MEVYIILAVVTGAIGAAIGNAKGRPWTGLVLGALFGFIGLIVIASIKPTMEVQARQKLEVDEAARALEGTELRACPWCAEKIQAAAKVCRYCGRDISADVGTNDSKVTAG